MGRYTGSVTFRVVLEYDREANAYSAVCPELPGCASAGDTEEEARANIREAIELYLAPGDHTVRLSMDDAGGEMQVVIDRAVNFAPGQIHTLVLNQVTGNANLGTAPGVCS